MYQVIEFNVVDQHENSVSTFYTASVCYFVFLSEDPYYLVIKNCVDATFRQTTKLNVFFAIKCITYIDC